MASTTTIYTGGGIPQLQSLNKTWARITGVYSLTNPIIGAQKFVDIQQGALQCSGDAGTYGNQHWRSAITSDGSFTLNPGGNMAGQVATIDWTTLLISLKPPYTGDMSTQHFRIFVDTIGHWYLTCDALPPCYLLNIDPATSNLKMSSAAGPGAAWQFNQLNKVESTHHGGQEEVEGATSSYLYSQYIGISIDIVPAANYT